VKKTASLDPLVDVYQGDFPVRWAEQFPKNGPLHVEIGFGMGEVLVREAQNSKDKNFIGIEYHWGRIGRTLNLITRQKTPINNIRILRLDARAAFEFLFPEKSVDHIYSLFPCPWPKKEHIKLPSSNIF
jgi:tRNA (guanine-N7-)-methyltransferase